MTVQDAARVLEVSPGTVYGLCSSGQLGHVRIGTGKGVIRISPEDIRVFLDGRRVEPGEARGCGPERFPRRGKTITIPDVFADLRAKEQARAKRRS